MCKIIEDVRNEAAEQARLKEKRQIALNLLELGIASKEGIARATGLSLEQVEELAAQIDAKSA